MISSYDTLRPKSDRVLPIYPAWRVTEFAPIAAVIVERGITWTELAIRLSGPSHAQVLGYLSSIVDPGSFEPERADAGLLLLALNPADAHLLTDELPIDRVTTIELDDLHALLIDTPARMDRLGAQLCRDGRDCEAVVLAATLRTYQAQANAWIGTQPASAWLGHEPREIQWKFPVAAGAPVIAMLTSTLPEHCAWFFVATEGFQSSSALPNYTLDLPPDASGTVLVSRRPDPSQHACSEHGVLPPAIIETLPEWTRLREFLAPPW